MVARRRSPGRWRARGAVILVAATLTTACGSSATRSSSPPASGRPTAGQVTEGGDTPGGGPASTTEMGTGAGGTATTGRSSMPAATIATTPTIPVPGASPATVGGCTPVVDRWSTARLAEQVLIVSGQFSALGASRAQAAAGVGGFVLFGSPPAGSGPAIAAGIQALDAAAAAARAPRPWMSTDEEGGSIQRLAAVVGSLPAPRTMAERMSPAQVEAAVAAVATRMRRLGVGVDLAPVLDVAPAGDPIADEGERSFSDVGSVAATYGAAYAAGLRQGGVVAVGKHFPGLGGATADTDTAPATVPALSADPQALIPFQAAVAARFPVVMVGHPVVPGLSGGLPASLSGATYRLLASLGFRGLTVTDDLDARAVSAAGYPQPAAAVAAVAAGADLAMLDAAQSAPAAAALGAAVRAGRLRLSRLRAAATAVLKAKGLPTCT